MDFKNATRCCYTYLLACAQHTRHCVRIQWISLQYRVWRIEYARHWPYGETAGLHCRKDLAQFKQSRGPQTEGQEHARC
jgi:hypothetical protein